MSNQLVFITGGTGFLGSYIIKELIEKGHRVRAIRRSSRLPFFISEEIFEKVEWVDGDILDVMSLSDAMNGVDALIHAAAMVSFSKNDRRQLYQVNIEGTANVMNAAIEQNVKRVLHVSSVAALGRTKKVAMVSEEKKWEENSNNTSYAISKHHAEMHVWRAFAEGLDGVIINPSTILGFGDWNQSSCAIFKNVYRQFPWFTNGMNGFVGVEDVAAVAVRLLFSDIREKRFIVSSENRSFRALFNTIADGFGKKRPHREATKTLGSMAWRMEAIRAKLTGTKASLTKETAKIAQSKTSFDNHALLDTLPDFYFTPLDTVIKKACEKYLTAIDSGLIEK